MGIRAPRTIVALTVDGEKRWSWVVARRGKVIAEGVAESTEEAKRASIAAAA